MNDVFEENRLPILQTILPKTALLSSSPNHSERSWPEEDGMVGSRAGLIPDQFARGATTYWNTWETLYQRHMTRVFELSFVFRRGQNYSSTTVNHCLVFVCIPLRHMHIKWSCVAVIVCKRVGPTKWSYLNLPLVHQNLNPQSTMHIKDAGQLSQGQLPCILNMFKMNVLHPEC